MISVTHFYGYDLCVVSIIYYVSVPPFPYCRYPFQKYEELLSSVRIP